jgi:hypothetical protein
MVHSHGTQGHTLSIPQATLCQPLLKNHIIVPLTGMEWPMPPHNLARRNAQTNFVTKSTVLKFVQKVLLDVQFCQLAIDSVNRHVALLASSHLKPIFKTNLEEYLLV